jgi:hypothetical protein
MAGTVIGQCCTEQKTRMKPLTYLAALLLLLSACRPDKQNTNTNKSEIPDAATNPKGAYNADTLTFRYDSVKVYSKKPLSDNKEITDTAKATFVFPLFADAKLNKLVEQAAIQTDNPDDRAYTSYKDLATSFMKTFDDYHAANAGNDHTWFKEVKVQVLPQAKDYLPLQYAFAEYVGGAHINSGITYRNYRLSDLQLLQLQDILEPGKMGELTAVAEKIFRKNEGLPAKGSLEPGYFFEKGIFKLNDNFYLAKDGIHFLYNAYEIKAFAFGRTQLVIPYEASKGILKQEFMRVH